MVAGSSGCRSVGSFCGPIPTVTSSDEQSTSSPHQNQPGRGGVQAFMNGIIGPFMACWQPPITACVSPTGPYGGGCMGPAPSDRSPQATSNIQKPHPNDVLVRVLVQSINVMFVVYFSVYLQSFAAYALSFVLLLIRQCGRGGATNAHTGNLNFRSLVAANKEVYVTLTKKQKMLMARAIVDTVRRQEPPGRFLQKDGVTGTWFDIGLPRSLEKTSQALREKTAADKIAANAVDDRDGSDAGSRSPATTPATTPTNSAPSSPVSTPIRSSRSTSNIEPPEIIIPDHLEAQFNPQLARRRMSYPEYPPHASQPYLPNFAPDPRKDHRAFDYSRRYSHPDGPPPPPPPPPPSMYQHQPPPHYRGHDYRDHRSLRGRPPAPARMQPPPHPYPHKSPLASPIPSSPTSSSVVTPEYGGSPARLGAPQVSPGRRQEWKRRRASEDSTHSAIRVPDHHSDASSSASSLHRDMANRLSFREPGRHIASPSEVLQSRSRRSGSTSGSQPRPQGMSGLDALSNAALLKLREER